MNHVVTDTCNNKAGSENAAVNLEDKGMRSIFLILKVPPLPIWVQTYHWNRKEAPKSYSWAKKASESKKKAKNQKS